MNKEGLVNRLFDLCRGGCEKTYECPTITKKEIASVLHHLPTVITDVLLNTDRVGISGLGQFHAQWIGPEKDHLFAAFDYDKKIEAAVAAKKKNEGTTAHGIPAPYARRKRPAATRMGPPTAGLQGQPADADTTPWTA